MPGRGYQAISSHLGQSSYFHTAACKSRTCASDSVRDTALLDKGTRNEPTGPTCLLSASCQPLEGQKVETNHRPSALERVTATHIWGNNRICGLWGRQGEQMNLSHRAAETGTKKQQNTQHKKAHKQQLWSADARLRQPDDLCDLTHVYALIRNNGFVCHEAC